MSGKLRLDFGNLPLVDASIRVSFGAQVPLTFETINALHSRIRESFSHLTEPQRFEAAPGIGERTVEIRPGSITGVTYTGNDNGLHATVQDQVVVLRWLKQVAPGGPDYPRFPVLRDALWQILDAFFAVSKSRIPVAAVNMSYSNFLKVDEPATVLKKYFTDRVHVKAMQTATQLYKVEISWQEHDGVDLRFRLDKVTAKVADEEVEGFQLMTIAGTRVKEPNDDPKAKMEDVHQRLQVFFHDLISDHAKREWQLKENDSA